MACERCNRNEDTVSALVEGEYYRAICSPCLGDIGKLSAASSGHQGYARRRDYEDVADEAVQPYNAKGPNPEFYRLYPKQAEKIFEPHEIEEVKRII